MDEEQVITPPEGPGTPEPSTDKPAPADNTTPDPVTETDGEVIADTDPQALPKLRLRETRLAQERDAARTEAEQLRTQLAEQETRMSDAPNPEAVTALTQERDAAKAEAAQLRTQVALTGKVVDPAAAATLMGDRFRAEDGTVDVDAFLTAHPYMRPQTGRTAPDGGGDSQVPAGKEVEIETTRKQLEAAQKAGNRVLAVSLQSKLTELTRAQ